MKRWFHLNLPVRSEYHNVNGRETVRFEEPGLSPSHVVGLGRSANLLPKRLNPENRFSVPAEASRERCWDAEMLPPSRQGR
jgi:hypothetical protein